MFVTTAKAASPLRAAAFYALALDSRHAPERAGTALRWSDLDLANARVKIERRLLKGGPDAPSSARLKGNAPPRTIEIGARRRSPCSASIAAPRPR